MESIVTTFNWEKLCQICSDKLLLLQSLLMNKAVLFILSLKNQKFSVSLFLIDIYKQLFLFQKNGKKKMYGGMFHPWEK